MIKRDAQIEFERILRSYSDSFRLASKPESDTVFFYIDLGIKAVVNAVYTQYERDQKLTDDLRLLTSSILYSTESTENKIQQDLTFAGKQYLLVPSNYMHQISDQITILPVGDNKCWEKRAGGKYIAKFSDVIECTHENLQSRLMNSLSEHKLHYAKGRPLRIMEAKRIELYTDGKYFVDTYRLTYLRYPQQIKPTVNTVSSVLLEYTDLTDKTLRQAIEVGVQLYIQALSAQNKSSQDDN